MRAMPSSAYRQIDAVSKDVRCCATSTEDASIAFESSPARLNPDAKTKEIFMRFNAADLQYIIAICAGVLILIVPRILNYVVALYLIVVGVLGLNAVHHFFRF
jgi:hypothetical protein